MNSGPNRRQPTRSVRTTTSRPSNYYARFPGYRAVLAGPPEIEAATDSTPGFFPAIEHFTDAISALPKETVRHLTLLKETEGKAYQPEQNITELLAAIDQLPPPPRNQAHSHEQAYIGLSLTNSVNGSASGSVIDGTLPRSNQTLTDPIDQIPASQPADEHSEARFELFKRLHASLREGAQVLDEKNTIFYAANEALSRQLSRIDNVIPHLELEISEEARVGSNTHWALPHMKELRRGTTNDRARRDVLAANSLAAAAAAVHETDIAATRSEARREAMLAKRHRNQNVDSDFEDRATSKRAHASTKVRRGQDGDVRSRNPATTNPPAKRRRVDNNGLVASNKHPAPGQSRAVAGSTADGAGGRKKTKPLTTQTSSRKRIAGNSPSLATSPIRGTFSTITNKEQSPAPAAARSAPSKARQNSVQSNIQENSRNRPSSGHKGVNGVGGGTPELKSVARAIGQTVSEARSGLKDTYNINDEQLVEASGVHGALAVKNTAAPSGSDMKREDTEPVDTETGSARGGHGSALIRSRGGSRGSKPTTPIDGPATDPVTSTQASRSRNTRGANGNSAASPPHKGGTSSRRPQKKSAAALAAAAAAAEESAWSSADDDGFGQGVADAADVVEDGADDNDEVASNEPVYCVCKQPSYGDMIACDNRNCPTEWFHLGCVGLSRPPGSKTKWYCEDCRELMKQKKDGR